MNVGYSELEQNGYFELHRLSHKELVPFIRKYIRKRTKFSLAYYLINVIIFAVTGYLFFEGFNSPAYHVGDRFTHLCNGLAIAFALVPVHEYIHVLAYRSQGAEKTSYAANLRKFYFMALADKFVANEKEFRVIALAPFVVITLCLLIALVIVDDTWTITIAGILLAHTAMCSGDFGLLSFFEFHSNMDVVTYDDVGNGTSLFFGKRK